MEDATTRGRLLTIPEIAEATRLPEATIRWKRHKGELPFTFKIGRRVVADEQDVRDWIDQQRQQSTVTHVVS